MDANNKREDPRAESDKRLQCFPLTAYVSLQPRRVILMLLLLCFVVFFLIRIRDGGASPMVTAVFSANNRNATIEQRRQLLALSEQSKSSTRPLKILYTMTTLAEYDGGGRSTTKGHDRMQNLLIPVLKEGVESLLQAGHSVDVVLVCYYKMTRPELIRQALPSNVGLNIWDEAAPYSYKVDKMDDPKRKLLHNTLALARQHRFVVKDHLMEYDFFLNFEDDMVIHADHVQNHMDVTQELFRLRESAPETLDKTQRDKHHGPLTKDQLKRMFPGLMRVEVLLDETKHGTQTELDPVPRYDGSPTIDSVPCCHLSASTTSATRPQSPTSDKLFLWETGIRALGVREMPSLLGDTQWVMLQRGPNTRQGGSHFLTKDYWSGTDQYFGKERRPNPKDFDFVNNMGGWMASQQQIWEWHTEICPGGFLPPYEPPHYNYDGMDLRNVEYWSGGLSLVTQQNACNLQRIVSLDPDRFAKHLIYHSSNNKQRQLAWKNQKFVKVNDLYAQLRTVQGNAQGAKEKEQQEKTE